MFRKPGIDIFLRSLMTDFEYSYVTIIDTKTGGTLCEGIANSLQKVVHFEDLGIKSFKVFESEDGSIFVDIYL